LKKFKIKLNKKYSNKIKMTVLPTYHKKRKNPPPAKKSTPSTTPSTQSSTSSFTSTILEGISFGAGSAIGHNIINKFSTIFSNEKVEIVEKENKIETKKPNCEDFLKKFEDCKKNYDNFKQDWNHDTCLDLFTEYENCKKLNN